MRDAYEVLHEKEAEITRLRHEIASLQIVAPLLSDDSEDTSESLNSTDAPSEKVSDDSEAKATGTDGLFSTASASRPKIWSVLKRSKAPNEG
jgi:hypothetical protein